MPTPTMPEQQPLRVAIIGGGIAGLSAAWYLQQSQDVPVDYAIFERSNRWGGKIHTDTVEIDTGPLVIERGPDGFITRKPWALALARELGLDDALVPVNDLPKRIYVLTQRGLAPLPQGLHLLVPAQFAPFMRSPLFSWRGKLRILAERFIPPRHSDDDESLADFVERRLGTEALDRLGEPLLAGVYNAEAERQSILATFPGFRRLEAQHGSLIRGMRAQNTTQPTDEPTLVAFRDGMQTLVDALIARLDGALHLNTDILSFIPAAAGDWSLALHNGEIHYFDAVIFTTPAKVTATLLAEAAPSAAAALREFRTAGIGSVNLAFRRGDVPHLLDAYGVVIPASAGRRIDGITWASAKWPGRAPADTALMRVFFGGPHTRDMLAQDELALLRIVSTELREILGITAPPLYHHITRWHDAYPQYDVGHLERVAQIEAALPAGLYVTGSPYRGLGLPDCIHQSQQTTAHLLQHAIHMTTMRGQRDEHDTIGTTLRTR